MLLSLFDTLDRDLFDPSLACPFDGPLTEEARSRGVPVYTGHPSPRLLEIKRKSLGRSRAGVAMYPFDLAASVVRLSRLIRSERFDLVLTNSAKAHIYGSMAARLAGRPVVWRLHDLVDTDAYSRLNIWFLKNCARSLACLVLTVSRAGEEKMAALGVPRSKLAVIYNGVEVNLEGGEAERVATRRQFGIDPGAPVVALVGRLVDWKGPDYFIKAAADVVKELPDARFLLVGDATFGEKSFVDELKEMCRELGVAEKVVFTGFRDDVPVIMRSIDLLVHASTLPEPFGMVLIEAMAASRPVVATRAGGVQEIVDSGVTGILVPPGDEDAMARAIVEILSDGGLRQRMGEAGLRRVEERFSRDETTRGIEREMLAILEERKTSC